MQLDTLGERVRHDEVRVPGLRHDHRDRRLREVRAWRDVATPRQAEATVSPDVLYALASLPHRKRACVVLRYYLDLSEADTAAALGISVGTVKSQTARALQRLRPLLADGSAPSVRAARGNEGGP